MEKLISLLQTKALWIIVGILSVIAGAVTVQTQIQIHERIEQQRKIAEQHRQQEEQRRRYKEDSEKENLRQPGDMKLP